MIGYVGIDPGFKGAAALLTDRGGYFIYDWQSEASASRILKNWDSEYQITALIERIFPINRPPSADGKSYYQPSSKLSQNYGFWRGILTAHEIEYEHIAPRTWQAGILMQHAGRNTKERAFNTIREILPGCKKHVKYKTKHDGRADALLLAFYLKYQKGFDAKRI